MDIYIKNVMTLDDSNMVRTVAVEVGSMDWSYFWSPLSDTWPLSSSQLGVAPGRIHLGGPYWVDLQRRCAT
jgi:hypothetical protein